MKADQRDGSVRAGFSEFLKYYRNKKIVLFSDNTKTYIENDLQRAGLIKNFDKIYCRDDLIHTDKNHPQKIGVVKNLGKVCDDFSTSPLDGIFIGDNHIDLDNQSAKMYGLKFLQVPQFRSREPDNEERNMNKRYVLFDNINKKFNFKSLIGKI